MAASGRSRNKLCSKGFVERKQVPQRNWPTNMSNTVDRIMRAFLRKRSMTEQQAQSVREEITKFVDMLRERNGTPDTK